MNLKKLPSDRSDFVNEKWSKVVRLNSNVLTVVRLGRMKSLRFIFSSIYLDSSLKSRSHATRLSPLDFGSFKSIVNQYTEH